MHSSVRRFARALVRSAMCAAISAPLAAQAQKFPDRPIKIVNTFSAGGPSDVVARLVAQHMSEVLGQSVIVESRPGAAGMIASGYVATQPADGYTLLLANNQVNSNSLLYKKLPYKMSDLAPVSLVIESVNAMCVPATLPVNNVKEFAA